MIERGRRFERSGPTKVTWLNLHTRHGTDAADVRVMIYAKLSKNDRIVVEHAHNSRKPIVLDADFASECARNGHLERLQWARTNGCPWNELTCTYAAEGRHLALLQWVRDNGCPEIK